MSFRATEKAFGNAAYVAFEGARKDRAAFAEEMTASIAHLAAQYHNERAEGGWRFRLLSAVYPALKLEESASESANLE